MRRRTFAIVAAVLAVLLIGSGAVYAYDAGRSDLIAEGVTFDGIDVGGMRAAQARAELREALLEPLQRPVVVRHGDERFRLSARRANVAVDVDGSVDRALDASRAGNALTRAWRAVSGGEVDEDVPAETTYDPGAVAALVKKVKSAVDEPAVDAAIDLEHGDVTPQPSQAGVRVKAARLKRAVTRRLLDRDGPRRVHVQTVKVEPEVTTAELAAKYPTVVVVNRGGFTLTLYENLELAKTYRIAVGQAGLETPAGLYHVQNKAVDPAWHVPNSDWAGDLAGQVIPPGPENPIKARWMGLYDGVGIHGTDAVYSLGTAASHGCIRMAIPDVEELYDEVPVGAPVYIS